jgi:conjugal transfer pilus assembly protein TraF
VAAAPGPVLAEWAWDRTREGWFWYEDPPAAREVPPEAQRPEPEPADPRDPAVREGLKRWPVDEARLAQLPVAWLRALQDAKLERALEDFTPEAAREYLLVHREHFRRSQAFTDLWRLVLYTHPELDPAAAHPVSTAGLKVADALEREARQAQLAAWAERAGLYFFFRSTCPYCRAFAPVLKLFADTHGWRVLPITQDGRGLPEFPDARPDEGVGDAIGVRAVPAVYVAIPEERFLAPVGQGMLTLAELEDRVLAVLENRARLARKEEGR